MNKIGKLLGIIFVLCMVFFIISDEKGIKFVWEGNHITLHKIEKNSSLYNNAIKNSNLIQINPEFENPKTLRKSNGLNLEYIAKLKEDKKYEEKLAKNKKESDTIQSNDNRISDIDSIASLFEDDKSDFDEQIIQQEENNLENGKYDNTQLGIESTNYNIGNNSLENNQDKSEVGIDNKTGNNISDNDTQQRVVVYYPAKKYEFSKHTLKLNKGVEKEVSTVDQKNLYVVDNGKDLLDTDSPDVELTVNNREGNNSLKNAITTNQGNIDESQLRKPNKYEFKRHTISLRKGIAIKHNFTVDSNTEETQNKLSDAALAGLLKNEEIDIDTLESENDEFLQKVFQQTRDTEIMNLIVQNYLNEYQFVKAKRFIENLPVEYVIQIDPSLYLRVAFNSFSLSSKNVNENLTSIIQNYVSKKQISSEDANRYLGVLALMNRNYDRFFEISAGFTSEKYKSFVDKIQGYKTQISKQMGMPEYYFDTLVSLELFNQGLFQPAKVLSLYSLQKNPNYILPYQILAYANFLTNSRDTSIEYLKKLVDLDPTNAEKYRFLIGIANYWDEKYGQSAIMLTMIKRDNLRLDAERYLIRDYLLLKQSNKLISSWNKLLGYENLVASDFYTYFYEAFFHPYAEGQDFKIYSEDTELANKMLRVCSMRLPDEEKVVCMYGSIGKNIAEGKFDGLEQSLLKLVEEYPQGYLYHALGEYYIKQGDLEKAKAYLLKAVSSTQKTAEKNQIKKLLEDTM